MFVDIQALDRAHFLPNIGSGAETRSQYQGLCQALDEYTRKTFYEWTQTVDKVRVTLDTGRTRLIRSHSSSRFYFELNGNSNYNMHEVIIISFDV